MKNLDIKDARLRQLHCFSLAVVILACSGCSSPIPVAARSGEPSHVPTPESRRIVVADTIDKSKCKIIDIVTASQKQIYNDEAETAFAMTKLLNKAASIGGDTIQLITPTKAEFGGAVFAATVWDCGR